MALVRAKHLSIVKRKKAMMLTSSIQLTASATIVICCRLGSLYATICMNNIHTPISTNHVIVNIVICPHPPVEKYISSDNTTVPYVDLAMLRIIPYIHPESPSEHVLIHYSYHTGIFSESVQFTEIIFPLTSNPIKPFKQTFA